MTAVGAEVTTGATVSIIVVVGATVGTSVGAIVTIGATVGARVGPPAGGGVAVGSGTSVSFAISSMSILVRQKGFWMFSLLFAGVGIYFLALGLA